MIELMLLCVLVCVTNERAIAGISNQRFATWICVCVWIWCVWSVTSTIGSLRKYFYWRPTVERAGWNWKSSLEIQLCVCCELSSPFLRIEYLSVSLSIIRRKSKFEMDIFRRRSSLQLCRLCGRCDRHKIDILNHDFPFHDGNVKKLCEIILDCVGIKVIWSLVHIAQFLNSGEIAAIESFIYFQVAGGDKLTTKLCENCLTKVNYIFRFRELCEATEMRMRILLSLPNGNAQAHSAIGLLDFTSAQAVADENTNEIRENTALNEEKSISRKRQRSNKDSCDSET